MVLLLIFVDEWGTKIVDIMGGSDSQAGVKDASNSV
jgi:hypothetical protein